MNNTFKLLMVFIITVNGIIAQEKVDLFGVNLIYNPEVGLKNPASTQLENLNLNVIELDAFLRYPIQLNNQKTVFVNKLNWHFLKAPFNDLPPDRNFEANLHSIQYDFSIRHKLSDNWLTLLSIRPTLASNFKEGISGDDFFFQGLVALKYIANNFMSYGAGVSYSNGFGEPQTFPVLLFDYNTDRLKTSIKAPISASLIYKPTKISYGLIVRLEGGQYHLANNDNDGPIISNNETVRFSRYNIGPIIGWNLNENSRFEVSTGISLKRTLKAIYNDGSETDYDLENGWFFEAAFYFGK